MPTRISPCDLERDFARMLKALRCPSCELNIPTGRSAGAMVGRKVASTC